MPGKGGLGKARCRPSSKSKISEGEEGPKNKDSRMENGGDSPPPLSSRARRSSRSKITDYFPPSSIPSDIIDDIIQDEEGIPSEGGDSSGKENDLESSAGETGIQENAFAPVVTTRSKSSVNKMPLMTYPDNVSPPPSPSKIGASPSAASSPPTPHKIKLMTKPAYNKLKISFGLKKTAETNVETAAAMTSTGDEVANRIAIPSEPVLSVEVKEFKDSATNIKLPSSANMTITTMPSTTKSSKVSKKGPSSSTKNTTAKNNASSKAESHKVTEYFPIRRSSRKPKKELDRQHIAEIEDILLYNDNDDGLDLGIAYYSGKGRGIQAMRNFSKGEFVVEYAGDLVDVDVAKERERKYSKDLSMGCYMYYFKHNGKQYCVDATKESGRLGRLVNHSRINPNLQTKVVMVKEKPRLILVAKYDIEKYSEFLYDYGDRSKESLIAHPWLAL